MLFPVKIWCVENPDIFKIVNSNDEFLEYIKYTTQTNPNITWKEDYKHYSNPAAESYFSNFRKHQTDAFFACKENAKGQIILPTGTGKSMVQIGLHLSDAIDKINESKLGTYVIACHRIMLCKQLIADLISQFIACGIPFDVLFVSSESVSNSDFKLNLRNHNVTSTTNPNEIKIAQTKANNLGRHLLIVSTYHSIDNLQKLSKIDIVTYDEAHETVTSDFFVNLKLVDSLIVRKYFFTATPKHINKIEGMANEAFYGKVIASKSAKEMILAGEMVKPILHVVDCKVSNASPETMLIKTTIESFSKHSEHVYGHDANSGKIGPKLLVATRGTTELMLIHNSLEFREFCKREDIQVFAFGSSDDAVYSHNFVKLHKSVPFTKMKQLNDSDKAIFLHIDILSEGIDLPSITGVLLQRAMNRAKLLQTIGRACRLYKDDRFNLYNGILNIHEKSKFVKPWAHVLIPRYFDKEMDSVKTLIKDMYTEYGIVPEDIIRDDEFVGGSNTNITTVTEDEPTTYDEKGYDIYHYLESICDEIIEENILNLTVKDFLKWRIQ